MPDDTAQQILQYNSNVSAICNLQSALGQDTELEVAPKRVLQEIGREALIGSIYLFQQPVLREDYTE